jgi:hypothetical protein
MAGRPMNKLHQEDVRKKIQASQLINCLTNHVLKGAEMSVSQIKAAEVLLRKSLPDLSAVQLDANVTTRTLDQELSELNEAYPDATGGSEVA